MSDPPKSKAAPKASPEESAVRQHLQEDGTANNKQTSGTLANQKTTERKKCGTQIILIPFRNIGITIMPKKLAKRFWVYILGCHRRRDHDERSRPSQRRKKFGPDSCHCQITKRKRPPNEIMRKRLESVNCRGRQTIGLRQHLQEDVAATIYRPQKSHPINKPLKTKTAGPKSF